MELLDAIHGRRSVRKFTNQPIPREELEIIMDAALSAPSAMNLQPWHFVVLTKPEDLAILFAHMGTTAFSHRKQLEDRFKNNPEVVEETLAFDSACGGASCVVLAFLDKKEYRGEEPQITYDVIESVAAACQNICLAAYDRGIASCWANAACRCGEALRQEFAPDHGMLVSSVILGYANMEPRPIKKKAGRLEFR